MRWSSISELKESVGLQINSNNPNEIRAEVRRQIALIHPDKNKGEFSSDIERERFNLLTEALDYLDFNSHESQALIPVNQISEIVKAVNTALVPAREDKVLSTKSELRANYKDEVSSNYSFPRISSGVFAAICGALLAFQGNFEKNRVLGELVNSYSSQIFLLVLFIMFGLFFMLTWIFERKDEARDEWLLSEVGRRFLFERLLQNKLRDRKDDTPILFTLNDFTDEIKRTARYKTTVPFYFRRLSESLAEKIAKLHIEEFEHRKIINRVDTPRLDPMYRITEEVLKNL